MQDALRDYTRSLELTSKRFGKIGQKNPPKQADDEMFFPKLSYLNDDTETERRVIALSKSRDHRESAPHAYVDAILSNLWRSPTASISSLRARR
jgi:hypothetical protein